MAWGNFLSIPCPKKVWDNNLRKEMLSLLPMVGLIAGLIEFLLIVFVRALYSWIFTPIPVTAFFMTLFAFGVSGFMHADGFMDCCDAILSRRDLAERQRILKDSNVGAFAVISMIFMVLGTFAAFSAITERVMATITISYTVSYKLVPIINSLPLIVIPVISRAAAGACVLGLKPLETSQYAERKPEAKGKPETERKPDGASGRERGNQGRHVGLLTLEVIVILIILIIINLVLAFRITRGVSLVSLYPLLVSAVCTLLGTRISVELARRNLGGMSGDIAGFSICMGELIGLLALSVTLALPV